MTDLLLSIARESRLVSGVVDLTPLKIAASLLPDAAPAALACSMLDEVSAIAFHLVVFARDRSAEEWFDDHFLPSEVEPDNEVTLQLRSALSGLLKPKEPLKRRL